MNISKLYLRFLYFGAMGTALAYNLVAKRASKIIFYNAILIQYLEFFFQRIEQISDKLIHVHLLVHIDLSP